MATAVASLMLFQMFAEEGRELVEGDQVHAVIEVHMPGAPNNKQFLGLGGTLVRILAELLGMRLVARDEDVIGVEKEHTAPRRLLRWVEPVGHPQLLAEANDLVELGVVLEGSGHLL